MMKKIGKHSVTIIFVLGVLTGIALMRVYQQESSNSSLQGHMQENITYRDGDFVRVTHVIDGDTIVISGGEHVRLIGIDTPERGERYYQEATDHLQTLLDGKEVRMIKDVSERDRYGRLLRHIYVGDLWTNAAMISDGYAHAVTFPPDVAHREFFGQLEDKARREGRGLWQDVS